jgi:hypothetical protein
MQDEYNDVGGGFADFEESSQFTPQQLDNSTFKQRNDPSEILNRYKLQLMNAYQVKETVRNEETGEIKDIIKIRFKKGTKPKANKQGIEDIISYLDKLINNHTVQGNITDMAQFNNKMLAIAQDITKHFMENKVTWNITLSDVEVMISNTINLVDLFLTRTLFNEERKGYGESFKDTTTREVKEQEKPNIFQRVGGFLSGKK